ncbi:MAG: Na+/H+ antiporter subunit E [Solirubrobacteraceae bacterium]
MIPTALRGAWYAAIYLLVLTSLAPGDIAIAAVLGLAAAVALRPHEARRRRAPPLPRMAAAAGMLLDTAGEMIRGSWRVARFCLGAPANPGLVEIPRGDRSPANVALWGILTGEAPDEFPVDSDDDTLLVHVLDASDPGAVRERHRRAHARWQRKVVP